MDDTEWRQDEREKEKVISDLSISLQDNESYFLNESLKGIDSTSEANGEKIKKAIRSFLENDPHQYFQKSNLYTKNLPFKQTIEDMYDYYTEYLEKKAIENIGHKKESTLSPKTMIQSVKKEELLETLKKVSVTIASLDKYVSEIVSIRDDLISEYFIDKEIGSTLNVDEKKEYTQKARDIFLENNKGYKKDQKAVKKIQKYFYEKIII